MMIASEFHRPTDTYTCPMHPEIEQEGPGTCTKCGMALESKTVSLPPSGTEYICPMHPEVVEKGPGNCPKCGMALESRTITLEEQENPELMDMRRRLRLSLVFTVPVFSFGL